MVVVWQCINHYQIIFSVIFQGCLSQREWGILQQLHKETIDVLEWYLTLLITEYIYNFVYDTFF